MENEQQDYAAIKSQLPGPLKILDPHDPLCELIRAAHVIYSDRNVRCVWMPPKPTLKAFNEGPPPAPFDKPGELKVDETGAFRFVPQDSRE
jgi:hypothetical protein